MRTAIDLMNITRTRCLQCDARLPSRQLFPWPTARAYSPRRRSSASSRGIYGRIIVRMQRVTRAILIGAPHAAPGVIQRFIDSSPVPGPRGRRSACERTRAGTGCGTCRPEVQRIVDVVCRDVDGGGTAVVTAVGTGSEGGRAAA
jgi:hypothetical protein